MIIFEKFKPMAMNKNCYKFVLWTCASSENEVTGEDIDIKNTFECDVDDIKNLKPGVRLFSPVKDRWGNLEFPDFNFTVVEVYENGLRLKSSFMYSSNSAEFDITLDNPLRKDGFWFGRYEYSYRLTLEKK